MALLLSPAKAELHLKLKKLLLCVSPSSQHFFSALQRVFRWAGCVGCSSPQNQTLFQHEFTVLLCFLLETSLSVHSWLCSAWVWAMNRKHGVLWSREGQPAQMGVVFTCSLAGGVASWTETAPLPAESVFSQCHYLI